MFLYLFLFLVLLFLFMSELLKIIENENTNAGSGIPPSNSRSIRNTCPVDFRVIRERNIKASQSNIEPPKKSQSFKEKFLNGIVAPDDIHTSFENFPYYLSETTKNALISSTIHLNQHNDAILSPRVLLHGGSPIYQETLTKALAKHYGAKILVVESLFSQPRPDQPKSKPRRNMLTYVKRVFKDICCLSDVRMLLARLLPTTHYQKLYQCLLCRGDENGAKAIKELFKVARKEAKDIPLIIFIKDIHKSFAGNPYAYATLKTKLDNLPKNILVIGRISSWDKFKVSQRNFNLLCCLYSTPTLRVSSYKRIINCLFPNKIAVEMPKDVVPENKFEKDLMANVIIPNEIGVSFDDIGGLEGIKNTLKELIILPLQRSELFAEGHLTKPCKGILLFGPPGTGKTMLAKAIATETSANFINISMSSINSKCFGEREKYVKAIFTLAKKISPSIIFVDQMDSMLGKHENLSKHDAMRKMKNEFMINWDGLLTNDKERVIVLVATNRPFDLDEAVISRLPRRLMVNLPDNTNRENILKVVLGKEELSPNFDYGAIAGMTDGYSGSDLKNLCMMAANQPIREILEQEKEQKAKALAENLPQPALLSSAEIRPLCVEDFRIASEQVSASYLSDSHIMSKLIEWNDLYGEGGSRKKTSLHFYTFI